MPQAAMPHRESISIVKTLLRIFLILTCLSIVAFAFMLFIYRDRRPPIFHAVTEGDTYAIAQHLGAGNDVNSLVLTYPFGGKRHAPMLSIAAYNGQLVILG